MSFNRPEKNARWVENQEFPYEIWSDSGRELAIQMGAAGSAAAMTPSRITRLVDAEGKIVKMYDRVSVGKHPEEVLEDCRALFGK